MSPLIKRVLADKRSIVVPLGLALAANLAVYVLAVRPLAVRSAGAADRAQAAAAGLVLAERDLAQATALVNGKARADEELSAFYQKVLPANFAAARRMTYASLPALARRSNVRYEERHTERDRERDDSLGRLTIRMVFQGRYESLREFIYQLESAPEFVIIDDITLGASEGDDDTNALTVNLSTYYRANPNGA